MNKRQRKRKKQGITSQQRFLQRLNERDIGVYTLKLAEHEKLRTTRRTRKEKRADNKIKREMRRKLRIKRRHNEISEADFETAMRRLK